MPVHRPMSYLCFLMFKTIRTFSHCKGCACQPACSEAICLEGRWHTVTEAQPRADVPLHGSNIKAVCSAKQGLSHEFNRV